MQWCICVCTAIYSGRMRITQRSNAFEHYVVRVCFRMHTMQWKASAHYIALKCTCMTTVYSLTYVVVYMCAHDHYTVVECALQRGQQMRIT